MHNILIVISDVGIHVQVGYGIHCNAITEMDVPFEVGGQPGVKVSETEHH